MPHKNDRKVTIIGYASCDGAMDQRCNTGPSAIQDLHLVDRLSQMNFNVSWDKNIVSDHQPMDSSDTLSVISNNCKELARQTKSAVEENSQIVVIGGDHSCAIGTWSGVHSALKNESANAKLGLIWIDAHMDSHTADTSKSGAIHGMPVATLLGHGEPSLCNIENTAPKILPENLCLVGIRSYEPEEKTLLDHLGVKVFYMSDIEPQGIESILSQAQAHISNNSTHIGISFDLDAIDPQDAPGVGSPERDGINGESLIKALKACDFQKNFLGIEITELNSSRDHVDKTAKLAIEAILACLPQSENA